MISGKSFLNTKNYLAFLEKKESYSSKSVKKKEKHIDNSYSYFLVGSDIENGFIFCIFILFNGWGLFL